MSIDPILERDRYRAAVEAFAALRPRYVTLADHLTNTLNHLCRSVGVYAIVQARAKSLESYAEKIQRGGKRYDRPLHEITDLCGVRIITHTLDEVERVTEVLEREFLTDRKNSVDHGAKMPYREFGYLSRHFIQRFAKEGEAEKVLKSMPEGAPEPCWEVQVRTISQHNWASVYHELGYKNEFALPERWEREFARLAALLEAVDQGFLDLKKRIRGLSANYEAYLEEGQLLRMEAWLGILLEVMEGEGLDASTPNAGSVLERLAGTYKGLSRWESLIRLYDEHEKALSEHAEIIRDVGVAYQKKAEPDPEGARAFLERAVKLDPNDVDAHCCLAGHLRDQGSWVDAREQYLRACHLDPTNPYALGNYIVLALRTYDDRPASWITEPFRFAIQVALSRCDEQIEANVNLPWACFDKGMFQLFLGQQAEALSAYELGARLATRPWMLRTHLKVLEPLGDKGIEVEAAVALLRSRERELVERLSAES
jgi:ppGpp synthetase/RelA/SpoT-type nucleotidyltranferase